jgi:death-on-curing protein
MFGEYLHEDIPHMAAAYLFHLATTQGFMDGNKRVALWCAIMFLRVNGYTLDVSPLEMYELTMQVANNKMDKTELAAWIRERMIALEE